MRLLIPRIQQQKLRPLPRHQTVQNIKNIGPNILHILQRRIPGQNIAELLHHPQAASLGLRRIAPTVLISTTPIDVLLPRLRELGASPVVEAADGISAIETYFLEKPEIVLLDVTMHGMSGIEVLTKLRELDPQARVIIATADIQSSTRILTDAGGAVGFITKPLASTAVLAAVESALRGAAR